MNRKLIRRLAMITYGFLWLGPSLPAVAANHTVDVASFSFAPSNLKIQPGDMVTWHWNDGSHSSTSDGSSKETWDSGVLSSGNFSHTFNSVGNFTYHCSLHANMTGRIVVGDVPLTNPIRARIRSSNVRVALRPVVPAGTLTAPVWGTAAPGDSSGRLFVADQPGVLWAIDTASGGVAKFADFTSLLVGVGQLPNFGGYDERGLLGFAFHPNYQSTGLLYTYTSEPVTGTPDFPSSPPTGTDPDHQSVLREWKVPSPADLSAVVDPASSRVILRIDQPQFNHNGGALAFGPDGMLYISLGDGGNRDDEGPGHNPTIGNGQDLETPLGKILRIDVDGAGQNYTPPYGIPQNNPFVPLTGSAQLARDGGCADGQCDEIFAYGLRNPFRMSFDPQGGALYAGDVGQDNVEEVDVIRSGGNYGWRYREGPFCFNPGGEATNGFVFRGNGCVPKGLRLTGPVAQYDHDEGTAIIGGFVYRGSAIRSLVGRYVFGDYAGKDGHARLFYLPNKRVATGKKLRKSGISALHIAELNDHLLGFARDAQGEIYVLTNATGLATGTTGAVWKLTAP